MLVGRVIRRTVMGWWEGFIEGVSDVRVNGIRVVVHGTLE